MERPPNILIFMTDQQRGDTVRPASPARTPRIDSFRDRAVSFENAFCIAPHCCPSRASFHTGLYPSEHGVWNNVNVANALSTGLEPGVRLFSEELTAAGYELFFCGKWHISNTERPADRGWREGYVTGLPMEEDEREFRWRNYLEVREKEVRPAASPPPGGFRLPGYGEYLLYGEEETPFDDEEVVESACGFLNSRVGDSAPWTLFVGPKGPHDPYRVPRRFLDLYDPDEIELPDSFTDSMQDKPGLYRKTRRNFDKLSPEEHRQALRHYYAFCSYEDYLFGRVLDALEATGTAEETLVIYLSDHGDYAAEHGLWSKGLPAFDSAYRVPALVRYPSKGGGLKRSVSRAVSLVDFAPTILDAAGLLGEIPAERFSGRSLLPFIEGSEPADWDDTQYLMTNGNELYGIQRIVRTPEWKYVYNGFDLDELYNLKEDPGELRNRIDDPACVEVVKELCTRMWRFGRKHGERAINPYMTTALAPYGPACAL